MRLIRLTKTEGGGSLWINPQAIESIERVGPCFEEFVGCNLRMASGAEWEITQSFSEVQELIREGGHTLTTPARYGSPSPRPLVRAPLLK